MEPWRQDATALAGLLDGGQVSAPGLLAHFRDRIDRLNPALNAVICLSGTAADEARASADRRAAGRPLGPLDGLPILIKDNFVVRGMPATWGSALFADRVCDHDEIPVERLRAAGAVIVGKTNVPEFTVEGFTENRLFGTTPNPWDLSLIPGGSSGGSVAAVAAGMIPFSVGTDGGGSVRRPAAYTNLVGLKTSVGRIPRGGGLPQLLLDMETVGPITRTVRDQALLFDVLAGADPRDHRSLPFPAPRARATLEQAPGPLRVLAVERFGDAPVEGEIVDSFRRMVDLVERLGHRVTHGPLPLDIGPVNAHWTTIADMGLGLLLRREPRMAELASPKYVEWARRAYDAQHLLTVLEIIAELRNRAARVFTDVDVIMTPACAAMPWPTGTPFPETIDGTPVGPRGSAVYSGWVNATGHPAISVPGRRSPAGLPIGIQFVGAFAADEVLLRLARQIEKVQDWHGDWPAVAATDPEGRAP
ncbi:MAG: amidase [Hyphomicrobiales bacterium]|nr:amidase [Hyphomicrobiales bacterium]